MNFAHYTLHGVFCMFVVALIGCSGPVRPADLPKLYSVTLTLRQDGEPLAGASVLLLPEEPGKWIVGGTSDENGRVTVRTHGQYDGAPSGAFAVVVTKTESESPMPLDIQNGSEREREEWQRKNPTARVKSFNMVEPAYGSHDTTPLRIEVKGKPVSETIDVGKPVRISIAGDGIS